MAKPTQECVGVPRQHCFVLGRKKEEVKNGMTTSHNLKNDQPHIKVKHPMLALISVMLGSFVGMFSETSLNIALPSLTASLHITTATASTLITAYMLVVGVVMPFSSFISKWFTTRQVVIFALSAFIFGAVVAATANMFPVLLIGRMIQGIGTGLILPLLYTVALQLFRPSQFGTMMGICALVIMFASAIGPTLTGLVLARLSWQWVFWLFVPFLVVALIFAVTSLVNVGTITKPKLDKLGLVESVVGFASVVSGASLASSRGWGSPAVLGLLAVGVIVLAFYVRRELKAEEPILNLRIFGIPEFRTGALLVTIDFGISLSAMYLIPQYFQRGLLLPVAVTGLVMLPGGILNALVSPIAGRLYDRYGARGPVRAGLLIALAGAVMLTLTSSTAPIAYVVAAHILLMVGTPMIMSPSETLALSALSPAKTGDGSTIVSTLPQILGAIVTALATSLLGFGVNAAKGQPAALAFTNGVHYGFYFTIVLIVLAFVVSLGIKRSSVKD